MGRAGGWREGALETCWAALCRDVQGCRLDIGATAWLGEGDQGWKPEHGT